MSVDPYVVYPEGPWEHRMVAANGSRFHLAIAGPDDDTAPLVVLLHGFPQFWWAWRHQLTSLAEAGYRVAAMDLRGYGGSDKPPGGYDIPLLADDVAGVIRSLGHRGAVVVGHGMGAIVAWSMPSLTPGVVRGVGVLGMPHPVYLASLVLRTAPPRTLKLITRVQAPWFPERAITHGQLVSRVLNTWSAPGWRCPDAELYTAAMRLPFAAHSAMEQVRWLVRSTPRSDGRRFRSAISAPVQVPVLSLHGSADRNLPPHAGRQDREMVSGSYTRIIIDGAGHFLPEEAPRQTTATLTGWLGQISPVS